jgi:hypothetical protein
MAALIPVIRYAYVPSRMPALSFKIRGLQDYSPGVHTGRVEVFAYELPDGVLPEIARRKWESSDLEGVVANLAHWFGDTVEGAKERLKLEGGSCQLSTPAEE